MPEKDSSNGEGPPDEVVKIRIELPRKVIEDLMQRCEIKTKTELFRSALAVLNWVAGKTEEGCSILAVREGENAARQLEVPFMEKIRGRDPFPLGIKEFIDGIDLEGI